LEILAIAYLIGYALAIIPIAKILQRAGFNPAWCALLLVPVVGVIGLYAFAFNTWPRLRDRREWTVADSEDFKRAIRQQMQ
jgi:sugar phosphate permease